MKDFKIGQLTKVLVYERLRKMRDRRAAAAEIVRGILLMTLKHAAPDDPGWRKIARDACRGAMVGFALLGEDLPKGAAQLLTAAGRAAYELGLDSSKMRESALNGFLDAQPFIPPDQMLAIQAELKRRFPTAAMQLAELFHMSVVEAVREK